MFFHKLKKEYCPSCKKELQTKQHSFYFAHYTKYCVDGHYKKEFLSALETFIETEMKNI
jgi:hypothetical protein